MTAHRCCPECGVELPAHGGTLCGCVGPFTAEHVDPMHIRPYVDLPEPDESGYGADPRAGHGASAAAGYGTEHAPVDGASAPDLGPFARCGTGETAELPALTPSVQPRVGRGSHAAPRAASRGGRRKGTVALAAAGVVAALGAGLLTTQSLTDDGDSGDDRSLSTDDRALPDVPSGGPTEEPTKKRDRSRKPSPTPSRTGPATPRADRDSREQAGGGDDSPDDSASAPDRSRTPDDRDRDRERDRDRYTPKPPQPSPRPGGPTLRPGDTGSEVTELQRRLKQAGLVERDAPEDGVYSAQVQQAVAHYQAARGVRGDRFGEYGPHTRQALESHTSG